MFNQHLVLRYAGKSRGLSMNVARGDGNCAALEFADYDAATVEKWPAGDSKGSFRNAAKDCGAAGKFNPRGKNRSRGLSTR